MKVLDAEGRGQGGAGMGGDHDVGAASGKGSARERGVSARRRSVLRGLSAGLLAPLGWPATSALATTGGGAYPNRPVRLVVPFAPGGATDTLGRLLGRAMESSLAQPMVVDNRVGAAGAIGATAVAKSPADGYTVLLGGVGTNIVLAYTQPSLPYDPVRDLMPVAYLCNVDYVLTVAAGSPYRSLDDLLAAARKRPRAVSYMSTGMLGPLHVALEYLSKRAGVSMVHVPYKGESPALADLLEGRIDVAVMTVPFTRPLVQDGRVRVLATISAERTASMPDVPTVAELGFPGYAVPIWNGLFVPAGTPAPVAERLHAAAAAAIGAPAMRERMVALGVTPTGGTIASYARFLQSERERWTAMIRDTGLMAG
ncbi:Bug family tripartite tricarboxylate transporter substrate binding protein [Cupriavidus sp. CP313]